MNKILLERLMSLNGVHLESPDAYKHTLDALHRLSVRELGIENGTNLTKQDSTTLMNTILPHLYTLLLLQTRFESPDDGWTLVRYAENPHTVTAIHWDAFALTNGDGNGKHCQSLLLQDYLEWNAAVNALRLEFQSRAACRKKIQRVTLSRRNEVGIHTAGADNVASIIEAAIMVLKDWYRSSHGYDHNDDCKEPETRNAVVATSLSAANAKNKDTCQ
jgi:hypothetical protein